MDAIPPNLQDTFTQQAMNGEDISNFNFGFMNHKGQFLDREAALKYAVDQGLMSPHDAKFGALTSTMMADSSKEAAAIDLLKQDIIKNGSPAISNGEKTIVGKRGQTHEDLLKKINPDIEKALDAGYDTGYSLSGKDFHPKTKVDLDATDLMTNMQKQRYLENKNILMADSSKEGAVIGALERSKSPFYSTLEKTVADTGQNKMTGDQWLGTLANKPGVKPEEMDWTGLKSFLSDKGKEMVSKSEVQAHLNDNAVKIGEVNKGELSDKDIMQQSKIRQEDWDKMSQSQKEVIRSGFPTNPTKFGRSDLVLPGGENYQEKLLTLPAGKPINLQRGDAVNYKGEQYSFGASRGDNVLLHKDGKDISVPKSEVIGTEKANYKSFHWDEPNVLAHVRTNDRDVGGVPSKHIEEIQSDWHQQGRDKGYKNSDPYQGGLSKDEYIKYKELSAKINEMERKGMQDNVTEAPDEWYDELEKLDTKRISSNFNPYQVPDAPFKKSWPELAMKRTIRQAVEEGKSRVSWTPGEAQAARYDLSKSIDTLSWSPKTGILKGFKGNNKVLTNKATAEQLPDFVGKEAAKKLLETKTKPVGLTDDPHHVLEGQDLKIGGEGMKGFYDQMLPAMVEKIGKKYGVKVQLNGGSVGRTLEEELKNRGLSQKSFNDLPLSQRNKILEKVNAGKPVHYFDIPEKMKQDVLTKGFPLFSKGVPIIPTQRDK